MEENTKDITVFSIKGALSWGWQTFKTRPWFYVGVILLVFVISAALSALTDKEFSGDGFITVITNILATAVEWWIYIGLIGLLLASYDGRTLSVSQLFEQDGDTLWNYILGTLLYGLIILGGILLLVFPAIIWGIKFHYYSYLIVDKRMKPIEALKQSAVITNGRKWTLFGFFIVFGLLNFAGLLAVIAGLFITIPVTLLASVYVYRWLLNNSNIAPA